MNKEEKKLKSVAIFILFLLPFIKLALSGLWAVKGNYIYAGIFAVASIIWASVFSAVLISFILRLSADDIKTFIKNNSDKEKVENKD